MASACPRCREPLSPRAVGRARVHECPRQHGLFLPAHDLRALVPVAAVAALEEAMERARQDGLACAACGDAKPAMRLLAVQRHGESIEVDACATCGGHWFDAGELERVRRASKHVPGAAASRAASAGTPPGASALSGGGGAGEGIVAAVAEPGAWFLLEILASLFDG